tara:strand:+ start:1335 stop:1670 length:336 start_codon:yes stop_codon:yes gene_type:complete
MDITFIAIAFFLLLAIVFLLLFLFKSINKKSFTAEDGSVFANQTDLDLYQTLYEKTKPLFFPVEQSNSSQLILGFEQIFLSKLTTDGFKDLKTLIKYRKQFKLLSDLINTK